MGIDTFTELGRAEDWNPFGIDSACGIDLAQLAKEPPKRLPFAESQSSESRLVVLVLANCVDFAYFLRA